MWSVHSNNHANVQSGETAALHGDLKSEQQQIFGLLLRHTCSMCLHFSSADLEKSAERRVDIVSQSQ